MEKDFNFLGLYIKQISRFPLLSAEEERKTAKKIYNTRVKIKAIESKTANNGDINELEELKSELLLYKNIMIHSNLRFVVAIAKKYHYKELSLLDLINEGNIGLITAVEKFDPLRGCRFITYAVYWIKQAMFKIINKLPKDTAGFEAETEEGFLRFEDNIKDENNPEPFENLYNNSLHERVCGLLSKLNDRERKILQLRYGLSGENKYTLDEVGKRLKISRERVRQIQQNAIIKLREYQKYAIAG